MPNYTSNGQAILLYENSQQYLWNNESVSTGQLSVAFQLRRVLGSFYPWGLSFEATFSADPGTFEIDLMGANIDDKTHYIQLGTITSVNSYYVGRWDMPIHMWPKYVAGYLKTLTNTVNLTLQVTR